MKSETKAVRHQLERTPYQEHSSPLFLTSGFVFEDLAQMEDAFLGREQRHVYSRYGNPNVGELVDKVCAMEGADSGLATASGMSAVFSTMAALLSSGDHVLASDALFGSTYRILEDIFPRWGISHSYVAPDSLSAWESAFRPNTKLVYLETPSNPLLKLADMEAIGRMARERSCLLVVDNCFATPYLQQPIRFGADLVIHSSTKFIDGQGRVLGGLVCGREELVESVAGFCRHTGPALSPFHAWLMSKSLETLGVRMDRHCTNAGALAEFLEGHRAVSRVIYPFLDSHPQQALAQKQMSQGGGIVSFEIDGGREEVAQIIDRTTLFSNTSNLGDTRSILTHPSSSALAKVDPAKRLEMGVSDGLIRISVGLEHIDDLIEDLGNALSAKG